MVDREVVEGMGDDIEPFNRPKGDRSLAEIIYHGQLQEKFERHQNGVEDVLITFNAPS